MARVSESLLSFCLRIRNLLGINSKVRKASIVNEELIVSFTSFPARIKNVWMVVDSILRQTMRPSHILLWLSEDNFPNRELDLPRALIDYKKRGLEICWVQEDIKPHKKYLYTFKQYPQKCVVTIDDDLYYRRDMLQKLWELHLRFPNCVCGHRGARVSPGRLYKDWNEPYETCTPSHLYYLTGCGGILYPVNLFNLNRTTDIETIRKTSLFTDDLWLKAMELLDDIPVVIGNYYSNPPSLPNSQNHSLMAINCSDGVGRNDKAWKALDDTFNVNQLIREKV